MDRDYAMALDGEVVTSVYQPFHMPETGRSGHVNIRYVPLANRYGYVTEVLGIVRDVTREYQEEAERRSKASEGDYSHRWPSWWSLRHQTLRSHYATEDAPPAQPVVVIPDDILATAAHELRTPINAILGYAESLTRELVGPLTLAQQEHLGHIGMSARHLLTVANRVLDLAKAEAGAAAEALTVQQRRSSAASAVSAALTLIRPQATARGIHLSSGIDTELDVWYYGDSDLVTQILVNLLANAVKCTPAGGRVVVFAGLANETNPHNVFVRRRSYLRVDDTGIGIAPSHLEKIFDPFVQGPAAAESAGSGESRGTGLGLAISRRLARLMGGDVTATSTPNVWSQFTLWLPADESPLIRT